MREALTGSRIRERRVMAGLKQADLAREAGISASYLNLIEHNRRRIGGKLLLNIAQALGVEPNSLSEGAEAALIASLREAAAEMGLAEAEANRADEFAGRFPGWAEVLAGSLRRNATLHQTVEALNDRLAHDPQLAASMHELLTTTASIRTSASILADTETLQPEWRDRFQANINEDSRRLADSAQALAEYLETTDAQTDPTSTPQDEVESFLTAHAYAFAALEGAPDDPATAIAQIIDTSEALRTPAGRHLARGVLMQYAQDARQVSLRDLGRAVEKGGADPARLAAQVQVPVPVIVRRLASLPALGAGLIVCDRAGAITFRKSIDGFNVPRFGACCPLWPLYAALGQPEVITSHILQQAGRSDALFQCYATSDFPRTAQPPVQYNMPPLPQAYMLLLPTQGGKPAEGFLAVGSSCKVCAQTGCPARREPSILSGGPV